MEEKGWTVHTLKEHFEALLEEKDKTLKMAFDSAKEAVKVAETNAEKWRDNANEWRAAMTDREKKFLRTEEYSAYKDANDKVIIEIKKWQANREGRESKAIWISIIAVIISVVIALIKFKT